MRLWVKGPYFNDPEPDTPRGSFPDLWKYEGW